jgi:hypothetical protein
MLKSTCNRLQTSGVVSPAGAVPRLRRQRRLLMKKAPLILPSGESARRKVLVQAASLGALAVAAPRLLSSAHAQADDLTPYRSAKVDWRQVEGESISVAVIPASYFDNLGSLIPQFEALTGIKVRIEKCLRDRSGRRRCWTSLRAPARTPPMQPIRCITRSTSPTSGSIRSIATWLIRP